MLTNTGCGEFQQILGQTVDGCQQMWRLKCGLQFRSRIIWHPSTICHEICQCRCLLYQIATGTKPPRHQCICEGQPSCRIPALKCSHAVCCVHTKEADGPTVHTRCSQSRFWRDSHVCLETTLHRGLPSRILLTGRLMHLYIKTLHRAQYVWMIGLVHAGTHQLECLPCSLACRA